MERGVPAAPQPDALIGWIPDHPGHASFVAEDGRGGVLSHLPDVRRPIASAGKVVHLVAYARAVVAGRLDPRGRVPVPDWRRWYVPGTDGGAHPLACHDLGIRPGDATVTWDDLVRAMIDYSDNAAPDLLRHTLGDAALRRAAEAGGWTQPDLPSYAGEVLVAPGPARGDRRRAALDAARTYAADPARRAAAAAGDPTLAWWDGAPAGTARQLAGLVRTAATDGLGPQVSAIVRRHLERGLDARRPAGVRGAGQKGGNLPGLVAHTFTARRDDGTVASAALVLSGLPWREYRRAVESGAPVWLAQRVVLDRSVRHRLARAVGHR